MTLPRIVAFVLALMGISVSGDAATLLATGGVYGGPTQHKAYCYVFNAGRNVSVTKADIITENGTIVPQLTNTCIGTLFNFTTCLVASEIAENSTYACRIVIRQANANVRGTMDLRDQTQNVLVSSPLR